MVLARDQSQELENPSEVAHNRDGSWKELGTSMSAISLGLAATAILVSMFLIMAIFEHLIIPRVSFLRSRSNSRDSPEILRLRRAHAPVHRHAKTPHSLAIGAQQISDVFVLMPGEQHPTFIAQPAPLPCPREGICLPSHYPHVSCIM
ncbi:hypothetical protein Cni_G24403 [Canna indica]|uniref:Uncharacterized protein n=1 Tax=Canna indica TaxID=4628 RepID=A0AAQ3KXZ4_9LILI|nr:hypothetical protein Cni_G24403 [Canna indica]